jgi:hypothetical protein
MLFVRDERGWHAWVVRIGILGLTLATAYIHFTLGGLMFLANAAGYAGFAVLMATPLEIASRYRWLIRVGLIGFTVGTMVAWQLFGARFWLGYLDKGIEIALVALLGLEMFHYDGGPLGVARRAWGVGSSALRRVIGGR